MYVSIKKRFLAYVLCLSFLIGATAYKPQQSDAVALSTTAAVVALVASVMTACGVTYWASTEQNAVDYLGGKLETYIGTLAGGYSSLLDWLGINSIQDAFAILNGGVLSVPSIVANKILDFVSWFNQRENVQSGGETVGQFVQNYTVYYDESQCTAGLSVTNTTPGVYSISVGGSANTGYSTWRIFLILNGDFSGAITVACSEPDPHISPGLTSVSVKRTQNAGSAEDSGWKSLMGGSNSFTALPGADLLNIRFTGTNVYPVEYGGSLTITITGATAAELNQPVAIVEPSASVVVPPSLEEGQSLLVTTTAPIQQGDTQEEACESILDTVVSQDGLFSTSTTEGEIVPSAWTWLYDVVCGLGDTLDDIKNGILGLPSSIASAISSALSSLFIPTEAYIGTFVASLNSTFDNRFSILSYPFSLLGTFITKCATVGNADPILTWGNIYEPFSNKLLLPAGSYNLNSSLQNQTIAYAHSLYMIVVKGIISFQFVSFLYAWFCDVFHMKNDDFANPLDSGDDESDVDDGDGYDGFYSSY